MLVADCVANLFIVYLLYNKQTGLKQKYLDIWN